MDTVHLNRIGGLLVNQTTLTSEDIERLPGGAGKTFHGRHRRRVLRVAGTHDLRPLGSRKHAQRLFLPDTFHGIFFHLTAILTIK